MNVFLPIGEKRRGEASPTLIEYQAGLGHSNSAPDQTGPALPALLPLSSPQNGWDCRLGWLAASASLNNNNKLCRLS